ncbi:hypothetical protein BGZ83_009189 [Gryganskiella cystojenkinii]|nr:hypothetical protein BGZ83_009189 [Gryganskiella cystojenkinii]
MPVFAESASTPSDLFFDLVTACTCTCLSDSEYAGQETEDEGDDELFDQYRYSFNTGGALENGYIGIGRGGLFILLDNVRHWSSCAVFITATSRLPSCSAVVPSNVTTSSSSTLLPSSSSSSCLTYSAVVSSSSSSSPLSPTFSDSSSPSSPVSATPATTSTVEALAVLKRQYQQLQQQRLQKRQKLQLSGGLPVLRKPPVHDQTLRRDMFEPVRLRPSKTCQLYAGNRFQGKQKSGNNSYDVVVDIKHVNIEESSLCGYLHIRGLTEEYPELTTFFDAEIIGDAHSFVTRKWDADVKTDQAHWTLFKPFLPYADTFAREKFKYSFEGQDVMFMRWKEHFLVPDHRVEGIAGASFAGFYYICYNKSTGGIEGYYFHKTSEKFQKLVLEPVQDRAPYFDSFEFR